MARILVIDDDETVRAALKQALRMGNHEVIPVANGKEGIERAKTQPIDLVICDLFMPQPDGLETIAGLREHSPQLPVIAVSGGHLGSPDMLRVARELGANRVLEKPFETDELLLMIDQALKARPA